MRKGIVSLPFLLSIMLSSCLTPYSSEFACPQMGKGVCASVPDVYRMYKQGVFSKSAACPSCGHEGIDNDTFTPGVCTTKKVCEDTCGPLSKKDDDCIVCWKVEKCKPDTVKKYIDYRAEAVKDNSPEEVVVW